MFAELLYIALLALGTVHAVPFVFSLLFFLLVT